MNDDGVHEDPLFDWKIPVLKSIHEGHPATSISLEL